MTQAQGGIQDISRRLSEKFQQLLPLHSEQPKGRKPLTEKEIAANSEVALQKFYAMAQDERAQHGLGILSRARVAFGLQHHLIKAGYPPHIVKQVLFAMLTAAFVGHQKQ
jgi:hypothetical protein